MKYFFFFLFTLPTYLFSQNFLPRYQYNQRLEPVNKVISGAGQSFEAFVNFRNVMKDTNMPAIYMHYIGLKNLKSTWADGLISNLNNFPDNYIIPQIGLSMTSDGQPELHYEQFVADGSYDLYIDNLIAGLKKLERPAFIRIGYEFNGYWNGYQSSFYKQAFIRITEKIRLNKLEDIATVWCYCIDGNDNEYMSFYPGNNYVDWWAFDVFRPDSLDSPEIIDFCEMAKYVKKPVMIGESTPKYIGTINGETSWNDWFKPYFSLIHSTPGIKAFCYINWNWANYPQWSNWGDARLEMNSFVSDRYNNEMDSTMYLHATDQKTFRKSMNFYRDSLSPIPSDYSILSYVYPFTINWKKAVDTSSGVSSYLIYKNGKYIKSTLDTFYKDISVTLNDTFYIEIRVIDRAGNDTSITGNLKIITPAFYNVIKNPEANNGIENWTLGQFCYSSPNLSIDTNVVLSGTNSFKITANPTLNPVCIYVRQSVSLIKAMKYSLSLTAKSTINKRILIKIDDGNTIYLYDSIQLNLTKKHFILPDFTMNKSCLATISFYLGDTINSYTCWLDSINLIESIDPNFIESAKSITNENNLNAFIYPNPFTSELRVKFMNTFLEDDFHICLFALNGQLIRDVYLNSVTKGTHFYSFDVSGLQKALYICKIISKKKGVTVLKGIKY